jgi:hypothetical protein
MHVRSDLFTGEKYFYKTVIGWEMFATVVSKGTWGMSLEP